MSDALLPTSAGISFSLITFSNGWNRWPVQGTVLCTYVYLWDIALVKEDKADWGSFLAMLDNCSMSWTHFSTLFETYSSLNLSLPIIAPICRSPLVDILIPLFPNIALALAKWLDNKLKPLPLNQHTVTTGLIPSTTWTFRSRTLSIFWV